MPKHSEPRETKFNKDGYSLNSYSWRVEEDRPGSDALKGVRPTQDTTTDLKRVLAGGGFVAPEFRAQDELDEEERLKDPKKNFLSVEEIPAEESDLIFEEEKNKNTENEVAKLTWADELARQKRRYEEKKSGWSPRLSDTVTEEDPEQEFFKRADWEKAKSMHRIVTLSRPERAQYKGKQAWNLRYGEARLPRVGGNKKELGAIDLKTIPEKNKPNPDQLEAKDKMSFAERLQAGWLELEDLNIQHLREQFEDHSVFLDEKKVVSARQEYLEKLPVALDCLKDRSAAEFGPAFAQLIKLVEGFLSRNTEEIKKFDKDFDQQKAGPQALQNFVEKMVFRIAYFARLEANADWWDKKISFRNALDKLGDEEIPRYFDKIYGRSSRLTAQVELLAHQIRELAATLYERPRDDKKEVGLVKSLEQKVVNNGIRGLEVTDLFPLYDGGLDLSHLEERDGRLKQVAGRLKNWQHPDSSSYMSDRGTMTQENADKFNVLLKEILNKFLQFYHQHEGQMKKVNEKFVSPGDQLKKALQYIFYYHYRIYAPGATDSSAFSIISHFDDAVGKVAEGMYFSPLAEIDRKLEVLRGDLNKATKKEQSKIQKEIDELGEFKREALRFKDYLYQVTSRAFPLRAKVEAA